MRTRVGLAVVFAFGVLGLVAPTAFSKKPRPAKPSACAGGRYVITGNPRSTGKPTLKSGSITLRNSTVSLSAGCSATPVRLKRAKGGIRVRARWAQCAGVRGKVRLKAAIDSTCKRMSGSISTRRGKSRFDAELSLCGNGAVDAGEQCDGASCTDGSVCAENCTCDNDGIPGPGCTPGVDGCPSEGGTPTTTTTLTPGGGPGVTTTSLQNGGGSSTTTTLGNGGTTTTTLPGDHFKCYKLREGGSRFHPGPVSLVDQFGASANIAEEPERLCNPVDKNGEGISDPTAHLMCYDLAPQKNFERREVVVRNQFGDQILTVVRPESLCVPAEKDGVQSALNLNHFKCYRVAQRHGKFAQRTVTLTDQFETKTTVVQKPLTICNPVDKNGEGVVDPQSHLTCYRIVDADGQTDFTERDVSIEDQFTQQLVRPFRGTCRKASVLCVPSLKNPDAGTTTTTILPVPTTSTTVGTSTTSTSLDGATTTTSSSTSSSLPVETSTTLSPGTTSTSSTPVPTTTSTSSAVPTTTPTIPTTSSTVATPTTSSSVATPTTSTSTSSTTSSTVGQQCCNGATAVSFLTANAPGDCGDILNAAGVKRFDLACAGLYTGGGGNSVPLPLAVPDLGFAINSITACTGQTATLGATTSVQTGSNRNCTGVGCLFGAPLAVPNPGTPPTSVCVLNNVQSAANGMLDCSTGTTTVNLPLSSILFLTGDTATDPMATIPGVQPCPLCSAGICIGGTNNGMGCTPGTSTTGLGDGYPTSHDCPPDPAFNIGTLPIGFSLSSGTVIWRGTAALSTPTNPTSSMAGVFSGFCRDADDTGGFQSPAQHCWENGMAVGPPCSGVFESCDQRTSGAFGPNGNGTRTITAIGSATSLLGGPAQGTLVSIFTVPPTFNATVDAAGDLPGPGAVALPGTATLCPDAMSCP